MNYESKSKDSFKSRLRFYLYYCVIKNLEVNEDEFIRFDIDTPEAEQYVLEYTSIYHQEERSYVIAGKCLNTIYSEIKAKEQVSLLNWRRYHDDVFVKKFTVDEFNELVKATKKCDYCGITLDQINTLVIQRKLFKKNERGFSLELDRKWPNREYSRENCVMACYWCNNAKTDEFTHEEFKPIGEAIGQALRARLK